MAGIIDTILGTKTAAQEQASVNCGEVHTLWSALVTRYDLKEANMIFSSYVEDPDFRAVLATGGVALDREIAVLEKQMERLGIPLPPRPPAEISTQVNTEVCRDEFMFRTLLMGVQNFIDEHVRNLRVFRNAQLRKLFTELKDDEIGYFRSLVTYGRLKGWAVVPPEYTSTKG